MLIKVRIVIADNFTIIDGDPKFDKKWTEPMPAKQFAAEMVKHTYRKVIHYLICQYN